MRTSKALKTFIATLVAGTALFAAGCGGGDDTTTDSGASGASGAAGSTGASVSKDAFIQKADAICKTGNQTVDTASQALGSNPSPDQIKQFVDTTLVPSLQSEFESIKALTPPEGDEDAINSIIDSAEGALDEIKSDPSKLTDSNSPFDDANQQAQAYGLKVCGAGTG